MKRIYLIIILLLITLTACTITEEKSHSQVGKLKFEQTWHDFGLAMAGEKLNYTFIFKAEGGPVKITNIFTGCGCTTAELVQTEYAAGEQGEIVATVDTSDFVGMVYKEINVEYESGEAGKVDLALMANVLKNEGKANDESE